MYITDQYDGELTNQFNWSEYFSQSLSENFLKTLNHEKIVNNIRNQLSEDSSLMVFSLGKMMLKLMKGFNFKDPQILELGAATGLLSKWLLVQYGGKGTLVDKSETSYKAFTDKNNDSILNINYMIKDVFELKLDRVFDIACSFGLVEHFEDKKEIFAAHKNYIKPNGFIIILVPLDSPLTRVFFNVFPELNLGYRELLTRKELIDILKHNQLEILNMETSSDYVYDFIGVLCRPIT